LNVLKEKIRKALVDFLSSKEPEYGTIDIWRDVVMEAK
jgi:hypothetical protein